MHFEVFACCILFILISYLLLCLEFLNVSGTTSFVCGLNAISYMFVRNRCFQIAGATSHSSLQGDTQKKYKV